MVAPPLRGGGSHLGLYAEGPKLTTRVSGARHTVLQRELQRERNVKQTGPFISRYGVDNHGLENVETVHWNYPVPQLYEAALRRGEGVLSADGALVTKTGEYTGRSPTDKFVVEEPTSRDDIWWGSINQPISPENFDVVHERIGAYLRNREVFVQVLGMALLR